MGWTEEHSAGAYLEFVRHLDVDVNLTLQELKLVRERLDLAATVYSDMPGNPNAYGDAIPDGVIAIMEAEEAAKVSLAYFEGEIARAREVVANVSKPEARDILKCRYLLGMSWREVEKATGYPKRSAMRIRREALPEVFSLMPGEWREKLPKAF